MADSLPDDIDPGIRPIVEELNAAGFRTFASCEGGEGHPFELPTVRLYGKGHAGVRRCRKLLAEYLTSTGRRGFTIAGVYQYENGPQPQRAFVELTFWSREGLTPCQ